VNKTAAKNNQLFFNKSDFMILHKATQIKISFVTYLIFVN